MFFCRSVPVRRDQRRDRPGLVGGALDFLLQGRLGTLWSDGWFPRRNQFDLTTIFVGTLIVAGIAMLSRLPLGLGAALYLSEYASPRLRRFLKPIIETLAGVPSVVMGFFALIVISPDFVQKLFSSSDVPLQPAGRRHRRGHPAPRWSRPSPRTRCTPSRARSVRRRTGSGRGAGATSDRRGLPGRRLGDHRVADPGRLARDRRDDGRRDRRRRDRWIARSTSIRSGRTDDDGRDLVARDRLRSGRAAPGLLIPSLFFVGFLLFASRSL